MSAPDPNAPLPDNVLSAVWTAVDVAEKFSFAFVDTLRNAPPNNSDLSLSRIVHEASPDALAYAFAAWMNACTAAYQPPKHAGSKP